MAHCSIHNCYIQPGKECFECNQRNYSNNKRTQVEAKAIEKQTLILERKTKTDELRKLRDRLQSTWRGVIFPYYKSLGLTDRCWICNRAFLYGQSHPMAVPHVMHYYPKSVIHQLWTDPVNSGIGCHTCNVVDGMTDIMFDMEPMMIKTWGMQRFSGLMDSIQKYDYAIKTEAENRYPTIEWLTNKITETQKMVIS